MTFHCRAQGIPDRIYPRLGKLFGGPGETYLPPERQLLRLRVKKILARMLPLGMQATCTVLGTVSSTPQVTKRSVECGDTAALKLQIDTVFASRRALGQRATSSFCQSHFVGHLLGVRPASAFHCPRVNLCEEASSAAAEAGSTGWVIFLISHHRAAPPRNLDLE